jgi:hypothetical protein
MYICNRADRIIRKIWVRGWMRDFSALTFQIGSPLEGGMGASFEQTVKPHRLSTLFDP